MSDGDAKPKFKYYHYDPSKAANLSFVILFAIVSVGHLFLIVRKKTWYFIPFLVGCLFEAIGYVGRVIATGQTPNWTLGPFIMQSLLILLAPALMAASVYMMLGRLVRLLDAHQHSIVRTTWLTKIFVAGDVLSFLTQGAGGGILSNADTKKQSDLGSNVLLAGLAIQVLFFGLFIITTVIFHIRITKEPTARSFSVAAPWRQFILALYAVSFLILVRSVFRTVEYASGQDSVLLGSEIYLLILDGALMLICAVILLVYHPSRALAGYKDDVTLESLDSRGPSRGGILPMTSPGSPGKHQQVPNQPGMTGYQSSGRPSMTGYQGGYAN
ncbi:RTA1 like protein-domain-containing protein [Lasiosphaeria miniovina]|uniref:RTA1 like protein-domain-containing protein n=1 Tax=Lasiosphaeria miniovina TaxID=1954250 RepID=A0AA40A6G2_9PEZI|nr:RTA1 like protein-domain-containing protein [Lasiosphaeria miniovina]KAK0710186.1 RTA1 like protein-domain-containing protein [Lasiosphaeria miniovina]